MIYLTACAINGKTPKQERIDNLDLPALFEELQKYDDDSVFVVGGESVYRELLPYCKKAYVTRTDYEYDADKYFPNLEALSVGNTTQEIIDMHYQKNLKLVNVTNALWLKTIIVGGEVAPEITGVPANDPTRAAVNVMFYVEKPDVPFKFKDDGIKDFCLRNKVDVDKDGVISKEEAAAVTRLSLMNFKSFMRNIKSYDDLQYFPNLEYFHAGLNYLETIDLSCCPKLTEIDLSDSRMLKTIVLAKGCKPEIKYPVAYKGEKAKIVHKR